MNIGILDIQGSVEEHIALVTRLGYVSISVKKPEDMEQIHCLIIPGGESPTIGKHLDWYALGKTIVERVEAGMPVYGTCAGAILLGKEVSGAGLDEFRLSGADDGGSEAEPIGSLGLLDVELERNGFGNQLDSFEVDLDIGVLDGEPFPGIFIRAPRFKAVSRHVEVLSEYEGEAVFVRQGHVFASSFHPELTGDLRVHKYFLDFSAGVV